LKAFIAKNIMDQICLNTCGFEHYKGLIKNFIGEEDPFELSEEYFFSKWYEIIKEYVCVEKYMVDTPKSYICSYDDLFNGKVDEIIQKLPGFRCFARLDTLSSKPSSPYHNANEIINDLQTSERTKKFFNKDMLIIIREWVNMCSFEFRCFVQDDVLRGISTEEHIQDYQLAIIKKAINAISHYSEFKCYCADFTFYEDGRLMLIEINTPVWLFACSGLFCLGLPYDAEILMGELKEDVIYPVIKTQTENNDLDDESESDDSDEDSYSDDSDEDSYSDDSESE
jgi:hypothetical protein